MRSRKPHSKSRNGCDPCKQRRVKCDEQIPACANCVIRRAQCHYSTRPVPDSLTSSSTKPQKPSPRSELADNHLESKLPDTWSPDGQNATSPTADGSPLTSPVPYDRLTELELMRTWCTKTCYSYNPKTSPQVGHWLGAITDDAFRHRFLLDAIMAVSCVQTATEQENPALASAYINTALQYQSNSLSKARTALQNVTSDNCDALFAFVLLSLPCSIVSAQIPNTEKPMVQTPTKSVLISFKYVHLLRYFMSTRRHLLAAGPFKNAFEVAGSTAAAGPDTAMKVHMHRLRRLIESYISRNDLLRAHLDAYHQAVDNLENGFVENKQRGVGWLSMAGEIFLEHLMEEEDAALLALMHWGVLLDKLDYMWWARFTGRRLVEDISHKIRGKHGTEWDQVIRWARAEVGLEDDDTASEQNRSWISHRE